MSKKVTAAEKLPDNLKGAALIGGHVLAPFLRDWRLHWGATDEEVNAVMYGDDIVPDPRWEATHAITIAAPVHVVWQWLVQIGQERGGLYSYEYLENFIGSDIHNADKIHPEWQDLAAGDSFKLAAKLPAMQVAHVYEDEALVICGTMPDEANPPEFNVSWAFALKPIAGNHTRLIARWRCVYPLTTAMRLGYGPLFVEPISFVMERRMLLGIKERAEQTYLERAAEDSHAIMRGMVE